MPASSRGAVGSSPNSPALRASTSPDEDAQAKRLRELRSQLERSALFKGNVVRNSAEASPPRTSRSSTPQVTVSGGVRLVAAPSYQPETPERRRRRRRTEATAPPCANESTSSSRRRTPKRTQAVSLQELVALARTGRVNEPNARTALPVVTVPPRHHSDQEEDRMSASLDDDEASPIMAEPVELVDDTVDDAEMSTEAGEAPPQATRDGAQNHDEAETNKPNSRDVEDTPKSRGTKDSIVLVSRRAVEEAAQDNFDKPATEEEKSQVLLESVVGEGSESPLPDFEEDSDLLDEILDEPLDEPLDDIAAVSPWMPGSSPELDVVDTKSAADDMDVHTSTGSPREELDIVGAESAEERLASSSPDSLTEKAISDSALEEMLTRQLGGSGEAKSSTSVVASASTADSQRVPNGANGDLPTEESVAAKRKALAPQLSNGTSVAHTAVTTSASASASSSMPAQKRYKKCGEDGLMAGWRSLLERTRKHPDYLNEYKKRFETEGKDWLTATPIANSRRVLGIDCEMVYLKNDRHSLARVSIVTLTNTLLDVHVCRAKEDVLDYRSLISGVQPEHLLASNGALPFEEVQRRVLSCMSPETILVGHSLWSDLRALRIKHYQFVDTALIFGVTGGNPRLKHKLHSLVSLMSGRVGTLRACDIGISTSHLASGPHDPGQDARWALSLALYEASNHPKVTAPLKLETFPTRVFLNEVPKGIDTSELKALFGTGSLSDVDYHLVQRGTGSENLPDEWLGKAAVTFKDKASRDAAFAALPRYVSVYAGPFRQWTSRRDVKQMQVELTSHFSRFGRVTGRAVRSCRVVLQNGAGKGSVGSKGNTAPFALLECHPAAARALVTSSGTASTFSKHRAPFKVSLMEERHNMKHICAVPVGNGIFIAKLQ